MLDPTGREYNKQHRGRKVVCSAISRCLQRYPGLRSLCIALVPIALVSMCWMLLFMACFLNVLLFRTVLPYGCQQNTVMWEWNSGLKMATNKEDSRPWCKHPMMHTSLMDSPQNGAKMEGKVQASQTTGDVQKCGEKPLTSEKMSFSLMLKIS